MTLSWIHSYFYRYQVMGDVPNTCVRQTFDINDKLMELIRASKLNVTRIMKSAIPPLQLQRLGDAP